MTWGRIRELAWNLERIALKDNLIANKWFQNQLHHFSVDMRTNFSRPVRGWYWIGSFAHWTSSDMVAYAFCLIETPCFHGYMCNTTSFLHNTRKWHTIWIQYVRTHSEQNYWDSRPLQVFLFVLSVYRSVFSHAPGPLRQPKWEQVSLLWYASPTTAPKWRAKRHWLLSKNIWMITFRGHGAITAVTTYSKEISGILRQRCLPVQLFKLVEFLGVNSMNISLRTNKYPFCHRSSCLCPVTTLHRRRVRLDFFKSQLWCVNMAYTYSPLSISSNKSSCCSIRHSLAWVWVV